MKKKVTKKAVAKTKTAKKVQTKKAKSIETVQTFRDGFKKPSKQNPYPYFRYGNVSVSDVSNDKFPEMVMITAGPSKYKGLMGKRYVNEMFAKMAIDAEQAENLIGKGKKSVEKELASIGIYDGTESQLPTDGHSLVETLI